MASKNARSASQRTVTKKRKGIPQTNPNSLANLRPFKSRAENGGEIDPRINQGGRPKLLGESYKDWLAKVNENDPAQRTNAELGAMAIGLEMLKGDVSAAREIRSATEGEKLAVRGEIELFNHDLISQLLARRPSGDHSESVTD